MKRILLVLLTLGLFASLGLFLWIRSWLTPENIRRELDTRVAAAYRGKVEIGSLGYTFPAAISSGPWKVQDPAGKTTYLSLEGARASLDLWALLERKVRVTEVRIESPKVLYKKAADGRWELLHHRVEVPKGVDPKDLEKVEGKAPQDTGPSGSSSGAGLQVQVDQFVVADLLVEIPGEAGSQRLGPADATLSLSDGNLEVRSLEAKVLDSLSLKTQGTVLAFTQAAELKGFDFTLDGALPKLPLDAKVYGVLAGNLEAKGSLKGSAKDPRFEVQVKTPGLTWSPPDEALKPIRPDSIQAKLEGSPAKVRLASLEAKLWSGSVTGGGSLWPQDADLSLRVSGVRLGTWLGPELLSRGFGAPLDQMALETAKVQLRPSSLLAEDLVLRAQGLETKGTLALEGKETGWSFLSKSKLTGRFEGADLISALQVPGVGLKGPLDLVLALAGEALQPKIEGSLRAGDFQVSRPGVFDLPVNSLTGSFRFQEGVLQIPDLDAKVVGGNLRGSAEAKLKEVPPAYSFQLEAGQLSFAKLLEHFLGSSPIADGQLKFDLAMQGKGAELSALQGKGSAGLTRFHLPQQAQLMSLANSLGYPAVNQILLEGKSESFAIENGKMAFDAIRAQLGDYGSMQGGVQVGLDQSLSGVLNWDLPLNTSKVPEEIRGKVLALPLKLSGTASAPKIETPDVGRAMEKMVKAELEAKAKAKLKAETQKLEAKAQEKIQEKLQGKLGEKLGSLLGGGSGEGSGSEGAKNLEEKAKEKVGGLFRKLLR